jgi:hypothetical protein
MASSLQAAGEGLQAQHQILNDSTVLLSKTSKH